MFHYPIFIPSIIKYLPFTILDRNPTRKNIYKDLKTGLLYYSRRESGSFDRIPQKMTVLQELEEFRKASGLVAMTSRSRGRTPPPSDKTLSKAIRKSQKLTLDSG